MRLIARKQSHVTPDCATSFVETDKRYLHILISSVKHGMERAVYVMRVFELQASYGVEVSCAAYEDPEK